MLGKIFALDGWWANVQFLIRWIHVLAGILWIGHLYFFNFVNANMQPKMDKDTKQKVNPQLMPRALFWFRWGAMITFIAGLILFSLMYMYEPGTKKWGPNSLFYEIKAVVDSATGAVKESKSMSDRTIWILVGMTAGSIMWFNVWFVIWPRQQKIVRAVRDGAAPDAAMVKTATLASKINTYLSAPMLFGMLAPHHYPGLNIATFLIMMAVAGAVMYHLFMVAPKVGTDI